MVKGIISAMTREIRGLHEAAYLLAIFTFLSQVLALVRDRAFAHFFGAGPTLDAYFAAFRIPDAVFALLTLLVSTYALVPLIHERGGSTSERARSLVGSVLAAFGIVGILASAVLFWTAPYIVPHLFPGFSSEVTTNVIVLSRIMLVQPLLLGLSSIVASVVQASRQFMLYALAPIFYNVGIIAGALFLYPALGVTGLAWGVVLGAGLHFLVQTAPLLMNGYRFPKVSTEGLKDVVRVVVLSFPRAAALSANQLLLLAFAGAASLAAAGSVAVISFAYNLQSVPLSVIGVSYASAVFPTLALLWAQGEGERFRDEVWAAVRHVFFWMAPAIALVVVLRAEIVRAILGSGAFDWSDTRLTAAILAAFALSLVAQAVILLFSRAYYAAGRSLVPIVINVGAAVAAALIAFRGVAWLPHMSALQSTVASLFRIEGIVGTEVLMVPLGYSVVYIVAALIFAILTSRRFGYDRRTTMTIVTSLIASLVGGAAAYGALQLFAPSLPTDTFIGILTEGAAGAVVGLVAWALTLFILRSREFLEIVTLLSK